MRELKNMILEYLVYAVIFSILVILVCSKGIGTSTTSKPQTDSTTVTTTDTINDDGV